MTSTTTPIKPHTKAELLLARAKHGTAIADIDRRLAELEAAASDPWRYTSKDLPADCPSRRAFAEYLRTHEVVGKRLEGHVWSCPRHAWHESRRRVTTIVQREAKPANDDEQLAERALAGADLRATRRSA